MAYLAKLLGAGEEALALRPAQTESGALVPALQTVGDVAWKSAIRMLAEADCSPEEAEAIYQLTSLCTFEDRFVIPPMHREEAIQMMEDPLEHKQSVGFGFLSGPKRGM